VHLHTVAGRRVLLNAYIAAVQQQHFILLKMLLHILMRVSCAAQNHPPYRISFPSISYCMPLDTSDLEHAYAVPSPCTLLDVFSSIHESAAALDLLDCTRYPLQDPSIKQMAEQIANDPSFQGLTAQLQESMSGMMGAMGGAAGGAEGGAAAGGMPAGMPGKGVCFCPVPVRRACCRSSYRSFVR
jgi:hypothetical protein